MEHILTNLTNDVLNNSLISNIANIYKVEENDLPEIVIADNYKNDVDISFYIDIKIFNKIRNMIASNNVINQDDYKEDCKSVIEIHSKIGKKIYNIAKTLGCNKIIVTSAILSILQNLNSGFKRCKENDIKHCNKFVGYLYDDIEIYVDIYETDDSVLFIKNIDIKYHNGVIYDNQSLKSDLTIENVDAIKIIFKNISFI